MTQIHTFLSRSAYKLDLMAPTVEFASAKRVGWR